MENNEEDIDLVSKLEESCQIKPLDIKESSLLDVVTSHIIKSKVLFTCNCGFDEYVTLYFNVELDLKSYCVDRVRFSTAFICPSCKKERSFDKGIGKIFPDSLFVLDDDKDMVLNHDG